MTMKFLPLLLTLKTKCEQDRNKLIIKIMTQTF